VPAAPGAAGAVDANGMQVLDEGPIHEAFAEPIALDARPRVMVDREPPEPINEVPPAVQPEGANVQWIPGYWMWSDVQRDFVWVSGVWRDLPPGRRWVPGHWAKVAGGFEWVSGLWAGAAEQELALLPNPPDTLEVGPSSPAPGDNFFWVPGCWIMQNNAFAWRAGYWYAGQPNWVWVPDHYCYTPRGAIFVAGFWDYPLLRRGLLFAPVWWPQQRFGYAGLVYRPWRAINTALLWGSLYRHDRYFGYYFGRGGWNNNHFRPWWDRGRNWRGYDPLYAYHRWYDGRNRNDWHDQMRRDWDRGRQGGGGGRGWPGGGGGGPGRGGPGGLVDDVERIARNNPTQVRIKQLTNEQVRETTRQVAEWNKLREARAQFDVSRGGGRSTLPLSEGGGVRPGGAGGPRLSGSAPSGAGEGRGGVRAGDRPAAGGGQVAVGGQGAGRANIGSPFADRRSTFKLPQTDSNIGGAVPPTGGTAAGGAVRSTTGPQVRGGAPAGRGEWQSRATTGPVVGGSRSSAGPDGSPTRGATNVAPRQFTQPTGPAGQIGATDRPSARQGPPQWQGRSGGRVLAPATGETGGGARVAPSPGRPAWSGGGGGSTQFRSQGPPSGRGSAYSGGGGQTFRSAAPQIRSSGGGGSPSVRGNYQPQGRSAFSGGRGGGGPSSFRSGGGGGGGAPAIRSGGGGRSGGPAIRSGGGGGSFSGRGRGRG